MKLTKEELEAAEREKLLKNLTDEEIGIFHEIRRIDHVLAKFHEQRLELEELCPHPLVARETKNECSSGNWDRDDSYWTRHRCTICDKRWTTSQRWERLGGRKGMPDDEMAKDW